LVMEMLSEEAPVSCAHFGEADLVHRAQQGDTFAFGELVNKYRDRVFNQIYRMIQNQDDALEITQKTFVKAWQSIQAFRDKSSFYTWLYKVATREAFEWHRRTRPRFVELHVDLRSPTAHPDREIQRNEIRQMVLHAVAQLSPKHRAVIVLKELEDLQYAEIAETLHCSIGTVMSRLFHARRKLQILLQPIYESLI